MPVQFVAVAKPFKHQLGVVSSLLSLNWELYDDAVITKSPLYLRDGDLMLWRDLREVPKEIATDGLPQVYTSSSSSSFWSLRLPVISSPLGVAPTGRGQRQPSQGVGHRHPHGARPAARWRRRRGQGGAAAGGGTGHEGCRRRSHPGADTVRTRGDCKHVGEGR